MTHTQLSEANEVIEGSLRLAGGFSLIPFPLVDLAALLVVQLRMTRKLAGVYEVSFEQERARALISSLMASTTPLVAGQALRLIPVAGRALGWIGGAAVAVASTYGLGKIFVQHLESGGTLLTLDAKAVEAHYHEQFERYMATGDANLIDDFSETKP